MLSRLFRAREANHAAVQQKQLFNDAYSSAHSYMHQPGKPVWMKRDYRRFAEEAYMKNVIAHRAVTLVARSAASVQWLLQQDGAGMAMHPALGLLQQPNPAQSHSHFVQALISYQLISGNAFVQAVSPTDQPARELYLLRPDRVAVIAGAGGIARGYQYKVNDKIIEFPVDAISGQSRLLHLKAFHPLDDWYGLAAVEAAAYAIDQHNQAGAWNQSLMQNGARPSGALVVSMKEHGGQLTEEQYYRIKQQMDEQFSGTRNAGRPLLLEGGLDWKEMSLSPKELDFIEAKHAAAREIALAFGVPPQLLGIPGDNTYSNLAEARLALWEQTVLPLLEEVMNAFNRWLLPQFGNGLRFCADLDHIPALSPRRDSLWARMKDADFLSDEEKRTMLGLGLSDVAIR